MTVIVAPGDIPATPTRMAIVVPVHATFGLPIRNGADMPELTAIAAATATARGGKPRRIGPRSQRRTAVTQDRGQVRTESEHCRHKQRTGSAGYADLQ